MKYSWIESNLSIWVNLPGIQGVILEFKQLGVALIVCLVE